jgi:hypothetical protein
MNNEIELNPNEIPVNFFELRRVVNGSPVLLKFPETKDLQAIPHIQDIMLKSLGRKMFTSESNVLNL